MRNEEMTVDEAYRELKGDITGIQNDIKDMATKADLKTETSRTRTWVISLFIGTVIIISTLIGVYANMTIALLR